MDIEVRKSKIHNRGVFTTKDFPKNEVIEVCPLIILPEKETAFIDNTKLYDYYFGWSENRSAIAFGYGSLYNHSSNPNALFIKDYKNSALIIKGFKKILKNEEITVNYNGNPRNKSKVWFKK